MRPLRFSLVASGLIMHKHMNMLIKREEIMPFCESSVQNHAMYTDTTVTDTMILQSGLERNQTQPLFFIPFCVFSYDHWWCYCTWLYKRPE